MNKCRFIALKARLRTSRSRRTFCDIVFYSIFRQLYMMLSSRENFIPKFQIVLLILPQLCLECVEFSIMKIFSKKSRLASTCQEKKFNVLTFN